MGNIEEVEGELEGVLANYPPEKSSLIPILQKTQNKFGYISKSSVEEIAQYLEISKSEVYGVATFYTQFRFEPLGEHQIKVCHGTACHVKGSEHITETIESQLGIKIGETTDDELFTLERVACLGCCSLAPVMMIDGEVYGNLTTEKVKKILNDIRSESS